MPFYSQVRKESFVKFLWVNHHLNKIILVFIFYLRLLSICLKKDKK